MEYITLNNGVKMPLAGLGTWNLRSEECVQTVSDAIKMGYRLIDTAQMYQNEKEVGEGIKRSGIPRSDLFVTTKIYHKSNSYELAKKAIDESLASLQLDYVDLFLLHEPYKEGPEMYRALEEALTAGKVRAIGISNYNEKWYDDFLKECHVVPMINQLEAHVFYQKWDFQKKMESEKTMMQAWSPLAQGIGNVPGDPILSKIGSKYGKTAAQTALRFLVQRGISVIPKSKSESRMRENLDLFDFNLSEEDMKQIKTFDKNETLFDWTNGF